MEVKENDDFWIATLDGVPCQEFPTRKKAVVWLKKILKQVLKDYDNQDKTDEYDYNIVLREVRITCVTRREPFLGL